MPSTISCHILDTVAGKPAEGITCTLFELNGTVAVRQLTQRSSNSDGRAKFSDADAGDAVTLDNGVYKIRFDTGPYLARYGGKPFFPHVDVVFEVSGDPHYHIPLLLSNYSYSTYRGS